MCSKRAGGKRRAEEKNERERERARMTEFTCCIKNFLMKFPQTLLSYRQSKSVLRLLTKRIAVQCDELLNNSA